VRANDLLVFGQGRESPQLASGSHAPASRASAVPSSTPRRTKPTGWTSRAPRNRNWKTKSPRVSPSTMTSWSRPGAKENPC